MQFTKLELAAMLKVGNAMMMADGRVDNQELKVIAMGMAEFGINESAFEELTSLADSMTPVGMIATLNALNDSQKRFVCGFLATIMISDGDIDDSEMKLWCMVSQLAGFPTMSIQEATTYWKLH